MTRDQMLPTARGVALTPKGQERHIAAFGKIQAFLSMSGAIGRDVYAPYALYQKAAS